MDRRLVFLFFLCWFGVIGFTLIKQSAPLAAPYYGTWKIADEPCGYEWVTMDPKLAQKKVAGHTLRLSPFYAQFSKSDSSKDYSDQKIGLLPQYNEKVITKDYFRSIHKNTYFYSIGVTQDSYLEVMIKKRGKVEYSFGYVVEEDQLLINYEGVWYRAVRSDGSEEHNGRRRLLLGSVLTGAIQKIPFSIAMGQARMERHEGTSSFSAYPQVASLFLAEEKQRKINYFFREASLWPIESEKKHQIRTELDCEVKYFSRSLISCSYHGVSSWEGAKSEIWTHYGQTVSFISGREIRLRDFVRIEPDFWKMVREKGTFSWLQGREVKSEEALIQELGLSGREELQDRFSEPKNEVERRLMSYYLAEKSLVLILSQPKMALKSQDLIEVEIPKKELSPFLIQNKNVIW